MSINREELFVLLITHELENKTHKGNAWQRTPSDKPKVMVTNPINWHQRPCGVGFLGAKAKSIVPHPSPGLHSSPVLMGLPTQPAFLFSRSCYLRVPARS